MGENVRDESVDRGFEVISVERDLDSTRRHFNAEGALLRPCQNGPKSHAVSDGASEVRVTWGPRRFTSLADQVIDGRFEPFKVLAQGASRSVVSQRFEVQPKRRQRRAQSVPEVRSGHPGVHQQVVDLVGKLVDGATDLGDLVRAGRYDPALQIPIAKSARDLLKIRDRTDDGPTQPVGKGDRDQYEE